MEIGIIGPVDLGGIASCAVMEAPLRPGAVYGEQWRLPEALGVVEAVREGRPIPETPGHHRQAEQQEAEPGKPGAGDSLRG